MFKRFSYLTSVSILASMAMMQAGQAMTDDMPTKAKVATIPIECEDTFKISRSSALRKIHCIWVGGHLPEQYLNNAYECAIKSRKSRHQVNIWVNNIMQVEYTRAHTMRSPLKSIVYRNVNELVPFIRKAFHPVTSKRIISHIREEMVGRKNYSAAADWLRKAILLKEGGIYSDIDHRFTKLDVAKGVDLYFLNSLPDDLSGYQNKCIVIGGTLNYIVDGQIQYSATRNVELLDLRKKVNADANRSHLLRTKTHLSPEGIKKIVGEDAYNKVFKIVAEKPGRINWRHQVSQQSSSSRKCIINLQSIDLPHGIKILTTQHSPTAYNAQKFHESYRNSFAIDICPDNCFIAAVPGNSVLRTALLECVSNYSSPRFANPSDDPLVVIDRSFQFNLSGKYLHKVRDMPLSYVFIPNKGDLYIHHLKDGGHLFYAKESTKLSEIDMKRAPDDIILSDSYGRRMVCSLMHAVGPIMEAMKKTVPADALVKDLFIKSEELPSVQLQWDNTWHGEPSPKKKPAFDDYDAYLAFTFGGYYKNSDRCET